MNVMESIVLGVHVVSAIVLVVVILTQRSEGGALSGLGGGSITGIMSARGTANILTRTTAILAAIFMLSGLALVSLSSKDKDVKSIIKQIERPAKTDVPLAE